MNEAQFQIRRQQICNYWQEAETYRLAYQKGSEEKSKYSKWLNWGTTITGALTGTSGLGAVLTTLDTQVLTAIFGVVTAIMTGISQSFKWQEESKELWRAQGELRGIQHDLQQHISKVASEGAKGDDPTFIERITQKLSEATKPKADNVESFRQTAKDALGEHFISTIPFRAGQETVVQDAVPQAMAEEAQDSDTIQRIVRGQAA